MDEAKYREFLQALVQAQEMREIVTLLAHHPEVADPEFESWAEKQLESLDQEVANRVRCHFALIASLESLKPMFVSTFLLVGETFYKKGNHEKALKTLEEVLLMSRSLVQKDPEAHMPLLGRVLEVLGGVHRGLDRHEEAVQEYQEALGIWRQLVPGDPQQYEPHLGLTLYGLGQSLQKLHRLREAAAALEECLVLVRRLVQERPEIAESSGLETSLKELELTVALLRRQGEPM
jgi:tetratricopeptide (TPR) repeat protein